MEFVDDLEKLPELEDKELNKHIDDVRNLLNKFNTHINDNPIEVINNDKTIRVMLSETILHSREQYNDLKLISDQLHAMENDTKLLSENTKPYYYKEYDTSTEIFKKMSTVLSDMAKHSDDIVYNIEELENKLLRMRRLYESILSKVCDYI